MLDVIGLVEVFVVFVDGVVIVEFGLLVEFNLVGLIEMVKWLGVNFGCCVVIDSC